MELRHYLRAIMRHWWIVAGVALVTVVALSFIWPQDTAYETTGTYVVRPRSQVAEDTVRATEALNRGVEINATYARVARSEAVKDRAQRALTSQGLSTEGLAVRSEVVAGTNILEIGATGPDPKAVAAYATAVGEAAAAYLDELGEVYLLEQLDPPGDPNVVASNGTLTLMAGLIFGILAGAVLAFGIEYLREPAEPASRGIRDRPTGLFSGEYFMSRLRQELARCDVPPDLPTRTSPTKSRSRTQVLTVGLVTLASADGSSADGRPTPLERRDVGQALQALLRPQDVLAYIGDNTFGVLFPDLTAGPAQEILTGWSDRLAAPTGGHIAPMHATVRTCECSANGLVGDEEIVRAACAG